jgi:hypothetical protein
MNNDAILTEIITVPSVWTTYRVPGNVIALLGNTATIPPQIVLEHLVAKGMAKRVGDISMFEAVPDEDEDEEDKPSGGNLWMTGKE